MPPLNTTGKLLLAGCVLWLASCRPERPAPGDWKRGPVAEGVIVEAKLPAGAGLATTGLSMGRPLYAIDEQALYFPLFIGMRQHVYRHDIVAETGQWREAMPTESTARRHLFRAGSLLGNSSYLRQHDNRPGSQAQPFGAMAVTLEQQETGYSRTYYRIGFPFGESGWVTRHYGDGNLKLFTGAGPGDETLLLSQNYKADNYSFSAGWSPDGRYVIVLEELTGASYHEQTRGRAPVLRFAVFGPYPVEKTEEEIIDFLARADEKARARSLDRKLAQGLITPEERYGRFYEELVETIRSCPALLAITGPVNTLTLRPGQTLDLSDGSGAEAGKYFTFDLQAGRGNGRLMAAAFYPETPGNMEQEIIGRIVRYDLSFDGRNHYFDACQAP